MERKTRYFEVYIPKILKNITSRYSICVNAKQQLNSAICCFATILGEKIFKITFFHKKKTVSVKEIETVIELLFRKNLFELLKQNANKTLENFSNFEKVDTKYVSRQKKSGLLFPPSLAEKFLRNFDYFDISITRESPIYFASILENIAIEILTQGIKNKTNFKKRITIRDIELGVKTDEDLKALFDTFKFSFLGGGVVPYINPILTSKKPRKKINFMDKKYRFKPGTVALRDIKKYQKSTDLIFQKLPFQKLVRKILEGKDVKISKHIFILLQYYIEQFITNILKQANNISTHFKRTKVLASDIDLLLSLNKFTI